MDYIISGDRYVAWDEDMEKVKLLVSWAAANKSGKTGGGCHPLVCRGIPNLEHDLGRFL